MVEFGLHRRVFQRRGQPQTESLEQDLPVLGGPADARLADHRPGSGRPHPIPQRHLARGLEELRQLVAPSGVAAARGQDLPEHAGQQANQDVRPHPVSFLMPHRADRRRRRPPHLHLAQRGGSRVPLRQPAHPRSHAQRLVFRLLATGLDLSGDLSRSASRSARARPALWPAAGRAGTEGKPPRGPAPLARDVAQPPRHQHRDQQRPRNLLPPLGRSLCEKAISSQPAQPFQLQPRAAEFPAPPNMHSLQVVFHPARLGVFH